MQIPNALSDRHLKSAFSWSNQHFDTIKNNPWDKKLNPTYVEVSFGYACNFKCMYCSLLLAVHGCKKPNNMEVLVQQTITIILNG